MSLLEHNRESERRLNNLEPIRSRIVDIFRQGKREQLLQGRDAQGVPFAQLAPSTLQRGGSGIPLVPHLDASRLITRYVVELELSPGRVIVRAGWPGLPWVRYHKEGTRRMPRRDPTGFREQDKTAAIEILRREVFDHG